MEKNPHHFIKDLKKKNRNYRSQAKLVSEEKIQTHLRSCLSEQSINVIIGKL